MYGSNKFPGRMTNDEQEYAELDIQEVPFPLISSQDDGEDEMLDNEINKQLEVIYPSLPYLDRTGTKKSKLRNRSSSCHSDPGSSPHLLQKHR